MQIILNRTECELIHNSLLDKRKSLLQNMSHGKDLDKEAKDSEDLHWTNELIKRMEKYVS